MPHAIGMRSFLIRISLTAGILFFVCMPIGMDLLQRGVPSVHMNVAVAADACTGDDGTGRTSNLGTPVQLPGGVTGCRNSSGKIFVTDPDGTSHEVNEQGMLLDQDGNPTNVSASRVATVAACSGIVDCLTLLPRRLFQYGMSAIAIAFVYLSSWILSIVALLFNWLVQHTIIEFGTQYGLIKTAVETAWTAFRDIANILIIGIFTFVAIGTILGLETFNAKKMVAKVLIIAVVINFSLLGTKMIIDASNYTATQIYTAAALGSGGNTADATSAKWGIADQFMNLLGVGTLANTWKTVTDTAIAKDSGWAALGHGILLTIILLATAAVLFYGCFLLVSRMIMLIFLLVTASIAFASYLVPKWSGSNYGWDAWWSSLIWCTTFAPMLMFLLWMTLNVSYALKGTSNAKLGAALSDPTGGGNIGALFGYVMVLGLLFTTFKLSSMWAKKIGGFSMAALVPGLGVSLAGRLAGVLGRNTVGAGAGLISRRLTNVANSPNTGILAGKGIRSVASRFENIAKRDFNVMNTQLGKEISATAGLKGTWTGATKLGGIEGTNKKAAEAYAKDAEKMAKTRQDEKARLVKEAQSAIDSLPENREKKRRLRSMEETAKANLEATQKIAEGNKKGHEEALKSANDGVKSAERSAESEKKAIEENSKEILARLERDKEYMPEGTKGRKDIEDQIVATRADRDSRMNAEEKKIEDARAEVTRISGLRDADKSAVEVAQERHNAAVKERQEFDEKLEADKKDTDTLEKEVLRKNPHLAVTAEDLASKLAHTRVTNLFGGLIKEDNDHLAGLAKKHVRESKEDKNLKRMLEKSLEDAKKETPKTEEPPPAH